MRSEAHSPDRPAGRTRPKDRAFQRPPPAYRLEGSAPLHRTGRPDPACAGSRWKGGTVLPRNGSRSGIPVPLDRTTGHLQQNPPSPSPSAFPSALSSPGRMRSRRAGAGPAASLRQDRGGCRRRHRTRSARYRPGAGRKRKGLRPATGRNRSRGQFPARTGH